MSSVEPLEPPTGSQLLRMATAPRWLGLLALVLVLCVVFGALGHWQLDVAQSKGKHKVVSGAGAPVAPLESVTAPQQVFRTDMVDRSVTVTGIYDAGRQVLVRGEPLRGRDGFWVLTALRTPAGALVPVVRGWVRSAAEGTAAGSVPPVGSVTVSGTLQPPESTDDPGAGLPSGQVAAADTATLVNVWGGPIYNVLVYAASAPAGLSAVPAPAPPTSGGLRLLNAAYALQWWLFGAFALLLWWRMVRQDTVDAVATARAAKEPSIP